MIGPSSDDILDAMRQSIFRIETRSHCSGGSATGFAVARLHPSNRLVLATAAHVLELPKAEPVEWTIQQFDAYGNVVRELVVETIGDEDPALPYRWHREFDVGVCVLPHKRTDGVSFTRESEAGLTMFPEQLMAGDGTKVGWAGFPSIVEKYVKRPQLCCFEGTISASVNRDDMHLYIVDGHSARGVSGGPLWTWAAKRNQVEVIGIMSQYNMPTDGLPGFCVFEPIEHVRQYLKWWNEQSRSAAESSIE